MSDHFSIDKTCDKFSVSVSMSYPNSPRISIGYQNKHEGIGELWFERFNLRDLHDLQYLIGCVIRETEAAQKACREKQERQFQEYLFHRIK